MCIILSFLNQTCFFTCSKRFGDLSYHNLQDTSAHLVDWAWASLVGPDSGLKNQPKSGLEGLARLMPGLGF